MRSTLFISALSAGVLGQSCIPDQLIDDFSAPIVATSGPAIGRNVNLFGGDYGTDSKNTAMKFVQTANGTPGYVSVVPTVLQTGTLQNFFFTKRNPEACFDLTGFTGLQYQMQVVDANTAAGTTYDSSFTLTQKSADCSVIVDGGESQYQPISKFVAGGKIFANQVYNITLPFSSFTQRNNAAKGSALYDFTHFKDFTWNAFAPVNVEYRFYQIVLKGNCTGDSTLPTNGTVPGTGSGSGINGGGSGTTVPNGSSKSGSVMIEMGLVAVIAAVFAFNV